LMLVHELTCWVLVLVCDLPFRKLKDKKFCFFAFVLRQRITVFEAE
jgi:hypothetical protein